MVIERFNYCINSIFAISLADTYCTYLNRPKLQILDILISNNSLPADWSSFFERATDSADDE